MDRAPYRGAQQTAGRTTPRPMQTDTPQTVPQPPTNHKTAETPSKPKAHKSKNPLVRTILLVVVVLLLLAGGWFAWRAFNANNLGINHAKYQAIFLSNGQVYFGKLSVVNDQYFKLTNVFYIQDSSAEVTTTSKEDKTADGDKKLIKLGKEVHGPEDAMVINRDQVTMYENLKSDGEVAKLINQYKE